MNAHLVPQRKRIGFFSFIGLIFAAPFLLSGCSDGGSGGGSGNNNDTTPDDTATLALPDTLFLTPESRRVTVNWDADSGVVYNLYWSTEPDFDPSMAVDADMLPDVEPPVVIDSLENDRNYYFYLEAAASDDTLLSDRWDTRLAAPGVDRGNTAPRGGITNLQQTDDGQVFVGGQFRRLGHSYGRLQVFDQRTGAQRAHPLVNERITAVAPDGAGGYYLATRSPDRILQVNARDELDPSFEVTLIGDVNTMTVHEGILYVGGDFSTIAGVSRNHLVAIDSSGNLLGWTPTLNGEVIEMAIHDDTLYVGGDFFDTAVLGDEMRSYAAAFDLANNRQLTSFAPEPNRKVEAFAFIGDSVVIGGDFTSLSPGGVTLERDFIAMVDSDGGILDTTFGVDRRVRALTYAEDWLYVSGPFNELDSRLVRFTPAGTRDTDWPIHAPDRELLQLVATDTGLFGVGEFSQAGDDVRHQNVIHYLPDGSVNPEFGRGLDSRAYDIAPDGKRVIVASEALIRVSREQRGIALMDKEGRWQDFPVELNGGVQALSIHNGNLYLGGTFDEIKTPELSDAVQRQGVAAIDITTTALTSFSPQLEHGSSLGVFHITPVDSDFLIGGRFSSVNGTSHQSLVRVDTLGAVTTSLPTPTQSNASVHRITLTDAHIYVAGTFEGYAGAPSATHVVRIHRTGDDAGSVDTDWLPEITATDFVGNAYGDVNDLLVRNNVAYMAGSFTRFTDPSNPSSTVDRSQYAAFNNSGNLTDWAPAVSGSGWTNGYLARYLPNVDRMLIGGTFQNVGDETTGSVALVDRSTGNLDDTSTLGAALVELGVSGIAHDAHFQQATGDLCLGILRHEDAERLRVGILCMDSNGQLLW